MELSGQISCISRKRCLSPSLYHNDDESEEKKLRLETSEREAYNHLQMVANIRSRRSKNTIFKISPYSYRCALCNIYFDDPSKCWNHHGSLMHLEHFKRNPNSIQFELCFNWEIATTENIKTNKKVNNKITSQTPLTRYQAKESATDQAYPPKTSVTTNRSVDVADESSISHSNTCPKSTKQSENFKPLVQFECKLCSCTAPKISAFNNHLGSSHHKALLKDVSSKDFSELIYISTNSWTSRKSRKGAVRYVKKANTHIANHKIKDATLYCPSCDVSFEQSEVTLSSVDQHFNSNSHKSSIVDEKEDCAIVKRLWTPIV